MDFRSNYLEVMVPCKGKKERMLNLQMEGCLIALALRDSVLFLKASGAKRVAEFKIRGNILNPAANVYKRKQKY